MRTTLTIALLATALAAPANAKDDPTRGLESIHVPVVTHSEYVFDAAAPDGQLSSAEQARLNAWLDGLRVDFGDRIYVAGDYASAARQDVARVVGNYGLMVSNGAPVVPGAAAPGGVRVIVSRAKASMPNCPDWSRTSQPNYSNRTMPNYGCAVNGNLAAMVADPNDLVYGRSAMPGADGFAAAKAIALYRSWELTAVIEGQVRRPFKESDTKNAEKK